MFKKSFLSDGKPFIMNRSFDLNQVFPPGYSYSLGGIIRTVKADVTKESSSPMREVVLSDGSVEILPLEVIMKDVKDPGCTILEIDKKYAIKKESKKKDTSDKPDNKK